MCPKCRSGFLLIKHRTLFERLMILITEKRKYCCQDCGNYFRGPDRRSVPREDPLGSTGVVLSASHGMVTHQ